MARTLLITFPSNDDANRFCSILHQLQTKTYEGLTDEGLSELADLLTDQDNEDLPQMDALVARPTLACKCKTSRSKGLTGYVRTLRFGWFVHSKCNRPTATVVKNFTSNRIMGLNDLLPEAIGAGKPVTEYLEADVVDLLQRKESIGA